MKKKERLKLTKELVEIETKNYTSLNGLSLGRIEMNSDLIYENNKIYMKLYCVIDIESAKAGKIYEGRCYDSMNEAERQRLKKKGKVKEIALYEMYVQVSGNMMDMLCSEDQEKVRKYYEENREKIEKQGITDEEKIIMLCSKKQGAGVLRYVIQENTTKSNLRILSKQNIMTYRVLDIQYVLRYQRIK